MNAIESRVFCRQSLPEEKNYRWMQFAIVRDECIVYVDMEPALWSGWNFGKIDVQGKDAWPDMCAEQIVAWKLRSDDRFKPVLEQSVAEAVIAYVNEGKKT